MKITVFALLLVAVAFSVLAAIFRSGMKQFDNEYADRAPLPNNVQAAPPWESVAVDTRSAKRLQPWLSKPVADPNATPPPAPPAAAAPAADDQVALEERLANEEALTAWHEELQARELALLEAEAAQQAWLDEQALLLQEQEQWDAEQAVIAEEQQALDDAAWAAQQEALAAAEEQQALIDAERQQLEAERAWIEEQQVLANQGVGIAVVGSNYILPPGQRPPQLPNVPPGQGTNNPASGGLVLRIRSRRPRLQSRPPRRPFRPRRRRFPRPRPRSGGRPHPSPRRRPPSTWKGTTAVSLPRSLCYAPL